MPDSLQFDRRQFILLLGLSLTSGFGGSGCERRYQRAGANHVLGEVQYLLFPKKHIRERALLLFRDDGGWSVLSTQCTHEGCDLTYQDQVLLCSCCESVFRHDGMVLRGPAKDPLPFYSISYRDNKLYADGSKIVGADYRFTTPEIERAVKDLRARILKEGIGPQENIPNVLLYGQGTASDVPVDRGTGNIKNPELPPDKSPLPNIPFPLKSSAGSSSADSQ